MYSTLERVIILKTIEIFAETPDVVLAEIATIMNEVDLEAGHTIFEKGTLGTSMYVIIEGQVRVHDSGHTLNMLGERAVFGEMAMLDPEPRSATVTAVKDSKLFVIEHAPFYDVLADRVEVARGIIRVLAGYVRARMRDVAALHARVEALEGVVHDHQRGPD